MTLADRLLTVFSSPIEERDGSPVIDIPEQELDLGDLTLGDSYRIAIISSAGATRDASTTDAPRGTRQSGTSPSPPVEAGEIREVEIEGLGEQGDGLARVEQGYIVFVPGTKRGDRVTVEITETRANVAFAEVVEDDTVTR